MSGYRRSACLTYFGAAPRARQSRGSSDTPERGGTAFPQLTLAGMAILRRERVFSICAGPGAERLARAMADLCRREGLEPCEAEGVIAEALTWPPDRPRDPEPLMQRYRWPD